MLEVEVQNHGAGQLASLKAFLLGFACPPLVAPQAVTSALISLGLILGVQGIKPRALFISICSL